MRIRWRLLRAAMRTVGRPERHGPERACHLVFLLHGARFMRPSRVGNVPVRKASSSANRKRPERKLAEIEHPNQRHRGKDGECLRGNGI
ncbi:MAG: hypothetical protein BAA03_12375 [Caldibacillus debilis]|nr:MAG: hypothetical protein BAA03_12375 [Caldibacillus debilis]